MTARQRHKALRIATRWTDILLHPWAVAFYASCFTFTTLMSHPSLLPLRWILMGCFFVLGVLLPIASAFMMKRAGVIEGFLHPRKSKDCRLLLLSTLIFFSFILWLSNILHLPYFIKALPLMAIAVMLAALIVSYFSSHVDGHMIAPSAFIVWLVYMGLTLGAQVIPALLVTIFLTGIKAALLVEFRRLTVPALLISLLLGFVPTILCLI